MKVTRKPARAELRAQLARSIASILTNPETPSNLYNTISDEITDWVNARLDRDSTSASFIAQNLEAYLQRETKRRAQ